MSDELNMPRRMNVRQAAQYLGVSKSWLDKKRVEGGGPHFVKLGRRIVYEREDLDAYACARKVDSTSKASVSDSKVFYI